MTETDATKRPLTMPQKFIPYLDKYRIYTLFKELLNDLLIELPKDHLKHMKYFVARNLHCSKEMDKVILLVSPDLRIDTQKLVKELIRDLGFIVITRRLLLDRYEKHDQYERGCMSPAVLAEVAKMITVKEPVASAGWLMFDHPCTVREARCLQQEGVLPSVTLVLMPTPQAATPTVSANTPARGFFQQDFEGLKYAYRVTLKEVHVDPADALENLAVKCCNAVRACSAGAQGPGQGFHVVGAPGVYRVLLIGPRGSGRKTQARLLAKHFGLVYLNFEDLMSEARARDDDIGKKLRNYGETAQTRAEIIRRRLMKKDCIDHGWVLTGYPMCGADFEIMDNMTTPPNRVIILNTDIKTCKQRALSVTVDWCTGKRVPAGAGPRAVSHPGNNEEQIDAELDTYFTEAIAELRAAAGITAVEIYAEDSIEEIQVRVQAAVIQAPQFNIETALPLRNVRGE